MTSRRPYRRNDATGVVLSLLSAALVLTPVLIALSCASIGTGRPEVVRAEDVLVNSLTTYDAAMTWHEQNSTKESPQVYKVFEKIRTGFPPAWKSLSAAIDTYKKTGAAPDLQTALAAVQGLITELQTVWASPK